MRRTLSSILLLLPLAAFIPNCGGDTTDTGSSDAAVDRTGTGTPADSSTADTTVSTDSSTAADTSTGDDGGSQTDSAQSGDTSVGEGGSDGSQAGDGASDAQSEADAELDGGIDASDASDAASADAADGADAAHYCDRGYAVGVPTGGITLFDGGTTLPAGHYRLTYADGCMIYGGGQPYTVHAYAPSAAAPAYATWLVVLQDGGFEPVILPGYWIYGADASPSPANYTACVTLNLTAPPTEFDYDAGVLLGVECNDSPLGDNQGGPDGGSPTWHLEVLSSPSGVCP
jgi:hypothetical protein